MRCLALGGLAFALVCGCDKKADEKPEARTAAGEPSGAAEPSAPRGPSQALDCLLTQIDAKDAKGLVQCYHPRLQARIEAELRRKKNSIKSIAPEKLAPLRAATPADFVIGPTDPDSKALGDQQATLEIGDDTFLAIRKDGRWYVIDSGV